MKAAMKYLVFGGENMKKIMKLLDLMWLIDILGTLIGIACIFAGVYQIYKPAAWIILGVILAWPGGVVIGFNKKRG